MTLPEVLLWQALRKKASGLKFRRQSAAGPYVLDFYCDEAKLAVEVDGTSHEMGDNPARDARRDACLAEAGIRTMRIPAEEVLNNLEGVILTIMEICRPAQTPPPPASAFGSAGRSPSPPGRN